MKKFSVAVIGATGVAGQQFLVALQNHPWFRVKTLAASKRSAGKIYRDAITDEATGGARWYCDEPMPLIFASMPVVDAGALNPREHDIVFTAVESDAAKDIEPVFAKDVPVVSTAAAFRYEEDVPILVPSVNMEHAELLTLQKKNRKWKGFIAPIPNCTTTGLVITLAALQKHFGVDTVFMTSMQALSGAGRSPGVISMDIIDNVIPYIPKEEEKVQKETKKILGAFRNGKISPSDMNVSATCMRVNVKDGHTESVFVSLNKNAPLSEVENVLSRHGKNFTGLHLPSCPPHIIVVSDDPYHPQPRVDRTMYDGMATVVGRLREDSALKNGIKYVLLSHNTKMGAAKGAVLVAEYLLKKGYIKNR